MHATYVLFIEKHDTTFRKTITFSMSTDYLSRYHPHTLRDKICRPVKKFDMIEDQIERFDMPDFIGCVTPHTNRYLSYLVCADQIGRN